ncbi:unnamed protein product [Timema podura]|uniref:Uncharacterized protein n=1 Tax=Timema podura TaxID=61482 RepID=A0ABN7NZ71_TIMPD|nr:unnamed protein product [Timema podura]
MQLTSERQGSTAREVDYSDTAHVTTEAGVTKDMIRKIDLKNLQHRHKAILRDIHATSCHKTELLYKLRLIANDASVLGATLSHMILSVVKHRMKDDGEETEKPTPEVGDEPPPPLWKAGEQARNLFCLVASVLNAFLARYRGQTLHRDHVETHFLKNLLQIVNCLSKTEEAFDIVTNDHVIVTVIVDLVRLTAKLKATDENSIAIKKAMLESFVNVIGDHEELTILQNKSVLYPALFEILENASESKEVRKLAIKLLDKLTLSIPNPNFITVIDQEDVALFISNSPPMSADRMKPRLGDWDVMIDSFQEAVPAEKWEELCERKRQGAEALEAAKEEEEEMINVAEAVVARLEEFREAAQQEEEVEEAAEED